MYDNPLKDIGTDADPPATLRHRVERSLGTAGLLQRQPSSRRRVAVAASIGLAAVLGFVAGRVTPASESNEPQFLLLLHGDGTRSRGTITPDQVVAEYARFADSLATEGRLVVAEKLADDEISVPAGAPAGSVNPTDRLGGFFLIRAPSLLEARAIAAASPHVRIGGRISLRPVEPTR